MYLEVASRNVGASVLSFAAIDPSVPSIESVSCVDHFSAVAIVRNVFVNQVVAGNVAIVVFGGLARCRAPVVIIDLEQSPIVASIVVWSSLDGGVVATLV